MSSPNPSRKRRAPGSVPRSIQNGQSSLFTPNLATSSDQLSAWNASNSGNFMDNSASNMNPYGMMSSPRQAQFPQQSVPSPSNALTRRGLDNQLVPTNRPYNSQQNDPWPNFGDENLTTPQNGNSTVDENDNIELLEEKASKAKRDAQAKRKQIPPFVQKLNSFLEESKNTELIRWSEKGDSFVVIDEDEFAKTLIPELFKHNNYASFVRQLNMYGFHKKVGLSDNSMKASERKNKSPSEYYNPYFKRGHPNLLWLINKPKSGPTRKKGKRTDGDDIESDDDNLEAEILGPNFNNQQNTAPTRALPAPESGPLQKKELAVVRDQMAALQDQQRTISEAITRLRREHVQLVNQATQFQDMHNRHENSINAILTFLANVFRKPLEEGGVVRDINDLFSGIIPNLQMPQGHSGSVVDLGDWDQPQMGTATSMASPAKRTQRLLPPIPQDGGVKTSASAGTTPTPYNAHEPQMGTITELFDSPADSGNTPSYAQQDRNSNPQEGMMRIMQDVNTNAGSGNSPVNLAEVGANTSTGMTNDQRNRMLSIMSGGQGSAGPSLAPSGFSAPPPSDSVPAAPASTDQISLSPIIGSSIPPPSLAQINQNRDEIDQLTRLQEEQSHKLDELSSLLGPYSPSGRIPGLADGGTQYFDENIDFGQYLDNSAFNADGLANDFDFGTNNLENANFDHLNTADLSDTTNGASRIVETNTPSHKSPSPSGTEEIAREDFEDSPGRAAKRQRQG
ncbi:putative heat shock transcription factor Hsf1 [Xylariales sp. AK1849]|nr:putative heat shock transcription factor Hsf1 [Xylariales sp. AK1849]